MRPILRIARTELATLFYSPIAWILLIVFACQVGIDFMNIFEDLFRVKAQGRVINFSLTAGCLIGTKGLYETIQQTLYLYIPLLTMGLMSREFASGSIKLLYSSPVKSRQIVLGKYLSMVIYALILTGILFLPVVTMMLSIGSVDIGLPLAGLLGLFLLVCAYMAIGLFMSCLTSYQVVAAVATLSALAFLNFIGNVGQEFPFVREITYWLSITGRASEMVGGLICSDDVIYFLVVIGLFLGMSMLKIKTEKVHYSFFSHIVRYVAIVLAALLIGYCSSRPSMKTFYDATRNKARTLSKESQEIVNQLKGPLKITTFCNILDNDFDIGAPKSVKKDEELFKQYVRFKPEIELDYVYYYAPPVDRSIYTRFPDKTVEQIAKEVARKKRFNFRKLKTPDEVKAVVDLEPEEYRFVRLIERGSGERSFLRIYDDMFRQPGEVEISVAMKKLIVQPVKIGFLTGHGEREAKGKGDQDYSIFASSLSFRQSMINQGFDLVTLRLDTINEISSSINMLLIAEMRTPLSAVEDKVLQKYIDRGGNIMILADARRQAAMNPLLRQFGVEIMEGTLVQPSETYLPNLITSQATGESKDFASLFKSMGGNKRLVITMPGAVALKVSEKKDFDVLPLLVTSADKAWLEVQTVNVTEDSLSLDTLKGERMGAYITAVAATRDVEGKQQRVLILGDADCFSNAELLLQNRTGFVSRNFALITTSFRWLSNDQFPLLVKRPANQDVVLKTETSHITPLKIVYIWVIPAMFAIVGVLVWWRRRGR